MNAASRCCKALTLGNVRSPSFSLCRCVAPAPRPARPADGVFPVSSACALEALPRAHARHALQDADQPEHVEDEVVGPPSNSAARRADALEVGGAGTSASLGMPSAARSAPARPLRRREVPAHAVVGEVRQRVAERRQLPVEHREDARLGGVEDHVVEPVVAVHDARLALGRVGAAASRSGVGGLDALGLRGGGTGASSAPPGARCSGPACRSRPGRRRRVDGCSAAITRFISS